MLSSLQKSARPRPARGHAAPGVERRLRSAHAGSQPSGGSSVRSQVTAAVPSPPALPPACPQDGQDLPGRAAERMPGSQPCARRLLRKPGRELFGLMGKSIACLLPNLCLFPRALGICSELGELPLAR